MTAAIQIALGALKFVGCCDAVPVKSIVQSSRLYQQTFTVRAAFHLRRYPFHI